MTTAVVVLASFTVALLVLLAWTQDRGERRVEKILASGLEERLAFLELLADLNRQAHIERAAAAEERRQLADRIQHSERVQVQPMPDYVPPEPPPDAAELAMIGQIVPEFVHVGTPAPAEEAA